MGHPLSRLAGNDWVRKRVRGSEADPEFESELASPYMVTVEKNERG